MEPPHPSVLREPAEKFRAYYIVTKGWEVGIYTIWYAFFEFFSRYPCSHTYFRAIAASRLTGIVGGSAVKMNKNWLSAYRYYSISYYAGVVKIVPQRLSTPALNASPATGSPSHPIYIASTQVTPASGTPTHPFIIPSTPNTPRPGSVFRRAIAEASTVPAPLAPFLSQGSPSPAFRPRQFLRAPAPVAQPTPTAASGSIPHISLAVGPIPTNSHISIFAGINIRSATGAADTIARRVVYVVDSNSEDSDEIPGATAAANPIATTTNTTPRRRVVYAMDSDSDEITFPESPTVSTHVGSGVGSSISTNPSTPINVASHQTSSLIVEADEDEYMCSDFDDDPEFLGLLDVVLATRSSLN